MLVTRISCVGMYSSTNAFPCSLCHNAVLPVFRSPRITIFTAGKGGAHVRDPVEYTAPRRPHRQPPGWQNRSGLDCSTGCLLHRYRAITGGAWGNPTQASHVQLVLLPLCSLLAPSQTLPCTEGAQYHVTMAGWSLPASLHRALQLLQCRLSKKTSIHMSKTGRNGKERPHGRPLSCVGGREATHPGPWSLSPSTGSHITSYLTRDPVGTYIPFSDHT